MLFAAAGGICGGAMARRFAKRVDLRDQIKRNLAAQRMYGVPEDLLVTPASLAHLDKPKRAYTKREQVGASEAQVLKAIRSALSLHPNVGMIFRMQSGVFSEGYRKIRVGQVGAADLMGVLKNGQAFAIEVKREKGGQLSDAQRRYLNTVLASGGKAGVARSVEQAIAIIEG